MSDWSSDVCSSDRAKAPSDAFDGAPRSYAEVPKLGPKLPGDLGRPILEKQRELDMTGPTDPAADAAARAAQEAETERQRRAAEHRASSVGRRAGNEWLRTCTPPGSPYQKQK